MKMFQDIIEASRKIPKVIPLVVTASSRTVSKIPELPKKDNPADPCLLTNFGGAEVIIDNDLADGNFVDIPRYVANKGRSEFYTELNENQDLCLVNAYKYEMENPK